MGKRFVSDFKKFYHYAFYDAKAMLQTEVANSYLNWIWWVLEPFCFMLIYTFIFGYVFKAREDYFSVYVFFGLALWQFFSKCVNRSVKLVKINKSVVSKIYLPKFILIIVTLMVNGFKMLVSMGIVVLMLIFFRVPIGINILYVIPLAVEFVIFTFGCCTVLLHYGVYVDDLANIVNIALRLVMYMTGIFFNIETRLAAPYNNYVLHLNPVAFYIASMRKAILNNAAPSWKWMLLYFVLSVLLCVFGIRLIYKNENNYVKAI